jgi:hypothetical protein
MPEAKPRKIPINKNSAISDIIRASCNLTKLKSFGSFQHLVPKVNIPAFKYIMFP